MKNTSSEKLNKIFQEIERPVFDFELEKWGCSSSDMSNDDKIEIIRERRDYNTPISLPRELTGAAKDEWIEYNLETDTIMTLYMPYEETRQYIKKFVLYGVTANKKISTADLLVLVQERFMDYFRLKLLDARLSDVHFSRSSKYKLSFGWNYIKSFNQFILDECKEFLNIRAGKKSTFEKYNEYYVTLKNLQIDPKILIKNDLVAILSKAGKEAITVKDLAFQINLNEVDYGIEKPITSHYLRNIISSSIKDFVYDAENDLVSLIPSEEFLIKAEEALKSDYQLVKNFPNELSKPGILALVFIGKDFPLTEATEYVNVRPIIYLKEILETANIHNLLGIEDSEIVNEDEDDIKYLKAILPKDTDYNDWLNNNLAVAFFDCSSDQAQLLTHQLIKKVSPVLNINQNPGNLFQQTLEQKLETYQKE